MFSAVVCCLGLLTLAQGRLLEVSIGVFVEVGQEQYIPILNASLRTKARGADGPTLTPVFATVTGPPDTFQLTNTTCSLLAQGCSVLVSLLPCAYYPTTKAIANRVGVPLVTMETCEVWTNSSNWSATSTTSTAHAVLQLVAQILRIERWQKVVVFYDEESGGRLLAGLSQLLEGWPLVWVSVDIGQDHLTGVTPRDLWRSHTNFIVVASAENLLRVLQMSRLTNLSVLGPQFRWLVLDPGKLDLSRILDILYQGDNLAIVTKSSDDGSGDVTDAETQLLWIARTLVETIGNISRMSSAESAWPIAVNCRGERHLPDTWMSLENTVATYKAAVSGNALYVVLTYTQSNTGTMSLVEAGRWLPQGTLEMRGPLFPQLKQGYNNRTFIVTSLPYPPFAFKRQNGSWAGLMFDLIDEICDVLNFSYIIVEPEEKVFGINTGDDRYNGMIGQLQRQEVDFGVGIFTVTSDRDQVVDFTTTFWQDPNIVLVRRPDPGDSMMFICLGPLHPLVWTLVALSVPLVGCVTWVTMWLHPSRHRPSRSQGLQEFDITLWQTFGALMQQGMVEEPRLSSGRFVVATWWLYVIVIAGVYNGNLIAFLTAPKVDLPIGNLLDILQYGMRVGLLRGTALHGILQSAQDGIYRDLWQNVDDEYLLNDSHEALDAVMQDKNMALLVEKSFYDTITTKNDSHRHKQCDLARTEDAFLQNLYALPFQKGSPYVRDFSRELLHIMESGLLVRLKHKWFAGNSKCTGLERTTAQTNIGLVEFQGAFYILGIGLLTAAIAIASELFMYSKCKNHTSFRRDFNARDSVITKKARWSGTSNLCNNVNSGVAMAMHNLILPTKLLSKSSTAAPGEQDGGRQANGEAPPRTRSASNASYSGSSGEAAGSLRRDSNPNPSSTRHQAPEGCLNNAGVAIELQDFPQAGSGIVRCRRLASVKDTENDAETGEATHIVWHQDYESSIV